MLTPEVKQAIADEVKAQLAAEQQSAQAPPPARQQQRQRCSKRVCDANPPEETPAALDPAHRTFIVSDVLNETGADGAGLFIVVRRRGDASRRHTGREQQRPGAGQREPEVRLRFRFACGDEALTTCRKCTTTSASS